ncbi:MAG: hypothetical protein ACJAYU_002270 [Bradymonadia bacterium]|jgi:hypothetical protein
MRAKLVPLLLLAVGACSSETEELSTDAGVSPDTGVSDIGSDLSEEDAVLAPVAYDDAEAGETGLRRLTIAQLDNIVADVFGPDVILPPLAEPDVSIGGLLSIGASGASFSPRGVESMESVAFALASQALSPEVRGGILDCEPAGDFDEACATEFVESVGRRLWRRPLTVAESTRIVLIADDATGVLDDFHEGLSYALAALLQSPNFLFRTELGADGTFNDWEMASRLSFFLWNTAPDDELLNAAESGELTAEGGLRAQAERLIASPFTRRGMRNFFSEYLELYELDHLAKDPTIFEHFSSELGADAREETLRLMEDVIFDDPSDYRNVMTSEHTFLNPRLATLYGVPAPTREGFGRVRLPADANRIGLLGHTSFLSHHAHQVSSSATLRGAAVRQVLLCQVIPPPPVNVDTSIPAPSGTAPTLRDRVAEHLENESCAGCHALMDPIGLGLENYDGIGRWRLLDNGTEIDASGDLDGETFVHPSGLAESLRNHPDFPACLVQMMTRYAMGRVEIREELNHLDLMTDRFAALEYRVQPMLLEIVLSPMFRSAGAPQ